ncbi:hypothetical protein CPB83DRAFT_861344 [Crepidotus variabilis]|uniref:Uncharacterized protein n=1 Tax=Crepidotus variabilis TaxID=179855 RepID=A0A9P6E845_9AGAR|nr:hypothetical protein CPB83DRAFT_861344 [Crepidotus variabilis]
MRVFRKTCFPGILMKIALGSSISSAIQNFTSYPFFAASAFCRDTYVLEVLKHKISQFCAYQIQIRFIIHC